MMISGTANKNGVAVMPINRKVPTSIYRHQNLGPLHDLLLKATVPDRKTGKKSITVLAKSLPGTRGRKSLTTWNIFLWIKNLKLPPERALQIVSRHQKYADAVGLPKEDRVSLRDFDQYVYKH